MRFVCDVHLGGLARYLRMIGVDAAFSPAYGDEELAQIACRTDRKLLSKDKLLLRRVGPDNGYGVAKEKPREQLVEVVRCFELKSVARPLTRCLECNELLERIGATAARSKVPPGVEERFAEFWSCPTCGKVFWAGGHYQRMLEFVSEVL